MQDKKEIFLSRREKAKEFLTALFGDASRANERLVGVIAGLAFGVCAYFLGSCPLFFGSYPLGVALLCAADRHLPFILTGLVLSAATGEPQTAVFIGIYSLTVIVRIFSRLALETARGSGDGRPRAGTPGEFAERIHEGYAKMFSESVYLRMASAGLAAFCLSLYALIAGGFVFYDLFGAIFSVVAAPAATFLFAAYFDRELRGTRLCDVGTLSLLAAAVYAMREFNFFGISTGACVAFFATLCVCRRRGILEGCVAGLALGLAFSPIYAPLFVLEAAAAGVLFNISPLAASVAGCVVGIIWGVYVGGLSTLSLLLPALLCGTMLFGAADRLSLITEKPELIRRRDDAQTLESLLSEEKTVSDEEAIKRLSSMFSDLAGSFFNLSDRLRRPGTLDLRRMCDGVFDKHCSSCPRRELCFGVEYSATLDVLNHLTSDLHMKAAVDISSVPDYLRRRCAALPQMINEINENCAKLTEHALMCDRTGTFALDYDGISKILSDALESGREDYIIDESSATAVSNLLKKLRFSSSGVIVYGGRRRSVLIKDLDASRAKIKKQTLKNKIEELLDLSLGEPKIKPLPNGNYDVTYSSRRKYTAEKHTSSLAASGEVSGDTVGDFCSCRDVYYCLISDGMGAGKEAAFTSRISSMFLEKMLTAGNRSETSLKLLNSFISERDGSRRSECSATIDLLEFDLLDGKMSLLKSGAAPTFVKRGGECIKLESKTVPIGILDKPDCRRIDFDFRDGDKIIMVSDGVTRNRESCVWLENLIGSEWRESDDEMARKIVYTAKSEGSDDDITAAVIEIKPLEKVS